MGGDNDFSNVKLRERSVNQLFNVKWIGNIWGYVKLNNKEEPAQLNWMKNEKGQNNQQ